MPRFHPRWRRLQVRIDSSRHFKSCVDSRSSSQGAAVCHRAIEDLDDTVKDKIAGVVTYGDTQNQQDDGQIPNFPAEKVLVICNAGDAVCRGSLTITAAHLDYVRRVPEAVAFLNKQISAAGGGTGT